MEGMFVIHAFIDINSSPPSAAHMHQWIGSVLVQIMAGRLFGTKPLPKPILSHYQLDKFQWNFNQNAKYFIRENASEKISSISLGRGGGEKMS